MDIYPEAEKSLVSYSYYIKIFDILTIIEFKTIYLH